MALCGFESRCCTPNFERIREVENRNVGLIGDETYDFAEAAVVASMMMEDEAITTANLILKSSDFYIVKNQLLFIAISDLLIKKGRIDLVELRAKMEMEGTIDKVGGAEYIKELITSLPSAANVQHYCDLVKQNSDANKLKVISEQITKITEREDVTAGEKLAEIETLLIEAKDGQGNSGERISHTTSDDDLVTVVEQLSEKKDDTIKTGFNDLDYRLGGFPKGSFNILAARPSMGKTALATNIAYNMAQAEHKPLIVSLEMTWRMITQRLICSAGNVNIYDLKDLAKKDDPELWKKVNDAANELQQAPVYIIDKGINSVSDVTLLVKSMIREYGIDVLFIDYIQLLEAKKKHENRQQEITTISRRIKAIAKDCDIPVIALSQLNRAVENRTEKKPVLSDLRESGSLEQDADVVMFIYREDYYTKDKSDFRATNTADILISKNRNGAIGNEKMFFSPQNVRFTTFVPGYGDFQD